TRSTPRSSTVRRASSGTRRRTVCTPRRRSWSGCCGRAEAAMPGGGWFASRWARLNGPGRVAGVDLARGLAVIGMFAAHLLATGGGWVWSDPSTWVSIVDGRSSILFATLAGGSTGLVTGGRTALDRAHMGAARGRIALRAALLLVLGILLIL